MEQMPTPTIILLLLFLGNVFISIGAAQVQTSEPPVPDVAAVLREVEANQTASEQTKLKYACTRSEEETMSDKNGKIFQREMNEYTVFHINGREIARLEKRDGKVLSAADQKNERERTDKEVLTLMKKGQHGAAGERKEEDELGIRTFLQAGKFATRRREQFRDRPVLSLEFEPNPNFKARTSGEKMAKKLAGTIWVDERTRGVMRVEARLVSDHRVGGLLAKLQTGSTFIIEQELVDDQAWLPSHEAATLSVRAFTQQVIAHMVTKYSNFKKFESGALAPK